MNGVCDCVQAYYSALVLAETRNKYQEFCIPIVVIPATINNNVPGTEFCIGSDTALNEIVSVSRPTGNTTILIALRLILPPAVYHHHQLTVNQPIFHNYSKLGKEFKSELPILFGAGLVTDWVLFGAVPVAESISRSTEGCTGVGLRDVQSTDAAVSTTGLIDARTCDAWFPPFRCRSSVP